MKHARGSLLVKALTSKEPVSVRITEANGTIIEWRGRIVGFTVSPGGIDLSIETPVWRNSND